MGLNIASVLGLILILLPHNLGCSLFFLHHSVVVHWSCLHLAFTMLLVACLVILLESLLMFKLHVSLSFLLLHHAKLRVIFTHHTLMLRMLNNLGLRRHLVLDFVISATTAEITLIHFNVWLVC